MRGDILETLAGIAAILTFLGLAHIALDAAQALWGTDLTAWIFG